MNGERNADSRDLVQDGFQKAYYGREVENPSVLQLLIGIFHKACNQKLC